MPCWSVRCQLTILLDIPLLAFPRTCCGLGERDVPPDASISQKGEGIHELQAVPEENVPPISEDTANDQSQLERSSSAPKANFDKDATHLYPYKPGERVLVRVKVIPRGGVGKLLRSWRGPFEVRETKQGGRWYILENGMITHYERLKPSLRVLCTRSVTSCNQ